MKVLGKLASVVVPVALSVALVGVTYHLSSVAYAQQADMHHSGPDKVAGTPAVEAQKSFAVLKTVAGTWQGSVTLDPPQPEMGDGTNLQVVLRVTSRGNTMVHEMRDITMPDDPAKTDHPVTMFYVDNDRLLLTHYCDAGNRPRMAARTTDGKTVEFDFIDVAGGTDHGHMHHAVFTVIDANHHSEDWTYMMPGDKPVHAHMELKRVG